MSFHNRLTARLGENRRHRGAYVEALKGADARHNDAHIGGGERRFGESSSFGTKHQNDLIRPLHAVDGAGLMRRRRYKRKPQVLERLKRRAVVFCKSDWEMLSGSLGDSTCRTRERRNRLRLQDGAMNSKEARRSENSSHIVGILYALKKEEHSTLQVTNFSNESRRGIEFERLRLNHYPFVVLSRGDSGELFIINDAPRNIPAIRPVENVVERLLKIRRDEYSLNIRPSGFVESEATTNAIVLTSLFAVEMRRLIGGSRSPCALLCGTRS